jgi:uncharacterized protein (DUF2147 family)
VRNIGLIARAFVIATAAGLGAGTAAADTASILGRWVTEGGKSHVEIYQCGTHLCGRIVWLREPTFKTGEHVGKPLMDTRNPDSSQRTRPIMGLTMMWNLAKNGAANEWEGGRLYNPEDGETYKGTVKLRPDGKLYVRGYIGISLLGKSQLWERVR